MYKLVSEYAPKGDQPKAIESLLKGLKHDKKHQVLLGVTGSGKTFTIANVIQSHNAPVLILSHNKTLASQLYSEFKTFFPHNHVEYFVSYFDYYRPEAYNVVADVFVDKTSEINEDLELLRMSAMNSIMSHNDTIIVASVSAIYGAINPVEYSSNFYEIEVNTKIARNIFFIDLVRLNYKRNDVNATVGSFSAKGDVIEITPSWTREYLIRVDFFGDVIEKISHIDPLNKTILQTFDKITLYPAKAYTTQADTMARAISTITDELAIRLDYFEKEGKLVEKQRLEERVKNDIDSMQEFGICKGIENYACHIDGRQPGQRPYTLLDFFPKNGLIIIDESHMTVPQLGMMYKGDRSRKQTLVDYGFRLPSALDNRPLTFAEFEEFNQSKIYVSATPGEYELEKTQGEITRQIIRPTGLLDPLIEVRPTKNQAQDILQLLKQQKKLKERTLILTITKKMAEQLAKYLQSQDVKVAYLHSEHTTFERNEILRKLRKGILDVVIGINLLREGIDLPEVSLMLVLDADKDGLFRSRSSLIQIVGRAARNDHGKVIFYADQITKSMAQTIEDNQEKRQIQQKHNQENNIIPKTIIKPIPRPIQGQDFSSAISEYMKHNKTKKFNKTAEEKLIQSLRDQMQQASKDLDFERAAELRDLIIEIKASTNIKK